LLLLTISYFGATAYLAGLPPAAKIASFVKVTAERADAPDSAWEFEFDGHRAVPLYLVRDGVLYLEYQGVQSKLIANAVDRPEWDAGLLGELMVLHPELRVMLPDPDAPDGGVRWLRPAPAPFLATTRAD